MGVELQPEVDKRVFLLSTLMAPPHGLPVVAFGHHPGSRLPAPELSLDLWVLLGWSVLEAAECFMPHTQVILEDLVLDMVRVRLQAAWIPRQMYFYVYPIPF